MVAVYQSEASVGIHRKVLNQGFGCGIEEMGYRPDKDLVAQAPDVGILSIFNGLRLLDRASGARRKSEGEGGRISCEIQSGLYSLQLPQFRTVTTYGVFDQLYSAFPGK
jgi:hypothetical protein